MTEEMTLEQRQALALARARRKRAEAESYQDPGFFATANRALRDVGQSANVALGEFADTVVGKPAAAVANLAGADVSPDWVREGLTEFGATPPRGEEPKGFLGAIGRMLGMTAGSGGTAQAVGTPFLKYAPETLNLAQRIVRQMAATTVKNPKTAAAVEGAAATVGGAVGETVVRGTGDESMRVYGELSPAAPPVLAYIWGQTLTGRAFSELSKHTGPAYQNAKTWLRDNFTKEGSGAKRRAMQRFRRASRDPEKAVANLEGDDLVEGVTTTTGQKAGDEGLMSLEKDVFGSTQQLQGKYDDFIRNQVDQIARKADDVVTGDVADTRAVLEARRQYLTDLVEARVRVAAQKANETLLKMGPNVSRETANRIVEREMRDAIKAVREQESAIWKALPETTVLEPANGRAAYAKMLSDLPTAKRGHIPSKARRFLQERDPDAEPDPDDLWGQTEVSAKEIHGLASEMREVARTYRSGQRPNYTRAKLADDIADALDQDLGAARNSFSGEVGVAYRTALDFSADVTDRFVKGPVAQMLRRAPSGGSKTEPSLILEGSRLKGPVGRAQYDALLRATRGTDEVAGAAPVPNTNPQMQAAVSDFLKDEFVLRAVRDGAVDTDLAAVFMREYDEIFKRLPQLKQGFDDAIASGKSLEFAQARQTRVANDLAKPSVSRAAVFLGKEPGGEVERVLKAANSRDVAREAKKQVRKDPTGKAADGLGSALVSHLVKQATADVPNMPGETFIAGSRLQKLMGDEKIAAVIDEWLSPPQLARLKKVARTALRNEQLIKAKPSKEGVISDALGATTSVLARIIGVTVGHKVGQVTPAGGPIQMPAIFSGRFVDMARTGLIDPARRMVVDAVVDNPALYRSMLVDSLPKGEKTTATQREAFKRINAWIGGVALEAGMGQEQE